MKYYAVTEDPNELLHYGVKGMKWGKHLFGDDLKPKSQAYKNAARKLKSLASSVTKAVNNTKNAIKKSSVQRSINKQKKQEEKFNEAVAKAQRRIDTVSNLNNLNKLTSYEKSVEQQYKAERQQEKANLKAEKAAAKANRKYAKNERKMERFMQEAREGRLKYGQLSDDQVRRVTDRLALERSARSLGSTEKPRFRRRMKEALQEGLLQGVTQGTAAGMREIAIAKVQNRLANKRVLDKKSEQQAERDRKASRIKNQRTHKEMREDIKDEAYEAQVRSGVGMLSRNQWFGATGAARALEEVQNKNRETERKQRLQARIDDEMDLGKNETYQKFLADQRERKRIQDVQDRMNNKTDEDWHNYLTEKGYTDADARTIAGYSQSAINGASTSEAYAQRAKILADNERRLNEEAYNNYAAQQKAEQDHNAEVARLEKENKKMKEDYESELKDYQQAKESDKKLKEKYDQDMAKYNQDVKDYNEEMRKWNDANRIYNAKIGYGDMSAKDPGPKPTLTAVKPNPPTYQNPKPPTKPKYHNIDYSEPAKALPSYEQFVRQKNIGINSFGNGGKKKGNKNN